VVKVRYKVEGSSEDKVVFHFDVEPPVFEFNFGRVSSGIGSILDGEALTPRGQAVGEAFSRMDGIEEACVSRSYRYRLMVSKGRLFCWEDLIPRIVDLLETHMIEGGCELVKDRREESGLSVLMEYMGMDPGNLESHRESDG
jgi:hypothetical protein